MRPIIIAVLLGLAACATPEAAEPQPGGAVEDGSGPESEEGAAPAIPEQCDAEDYRPLIGTTVAEAALTPSAMLRVYGENDIITQDYLPQRTNVIYDAAGVILRAECG